MKSAGCNQEEQYLCEMIEGCAWGCERSWGDDGLEIVEVQIAVIVSYVVLALGRKFSVAVGKSTWSEVKHVCIFPFFLIEEKRFIKAGMGHPQLDNSLNNAAE